MNGIEVRSPREVLSRKSKLRLISIVKQSELIVVLQLQQLKCLKRAIDE